MDHSGSELHTLGTYVLLVRVNGPLEVIQGSAIKGTYSNSVEVTFL